MTSSNAGFDRRLAAIFRAEAADHVQRMIASLARMEGAGAPEGKPLEELFRAAHSLKGAARAVGRDDVETACHAMESLLSGLQRGRIAWSRAAGDILHESAAALQRALDGESDSPRELLALLPRLEAFESTGGAVGTSHTALAMALQAAVPVHAPAHAPVPAAAPLPPPVPAPASATASATAAAPAASTASTSADEHRTLRIGAGRLASLLDQVEGLVALKSGKQPHALAQAVDRLLATVKTTLLVPVSSLSPFLMATVREVARSQGREVDLHVEGDHVELDRRLLDEMREPLVHLLRNAVAHGIEPPDVRAAAGKPARGRLAVTLQPRGAGQVRITVADDGAGIDTARLAAAAAEAGHALPESDTQAALLPLVFRHGLSTAPRLTQVAGRGVGLAIVRDTVERLGGTVTVDSLPGQGTTFRMQLPLSMATVRAVEVRAGGNAYLLPTTQVERCVRVNVGDLRLSGGLQTMPFGEERLALASLARLLELPHESVGDAIHCVVVAGADRRIALAVDEVRGEQEVLSRPVDPRLTRSPIVAGAAVLDAGRAVAILNVQELVRTALSEGGGAMGVRAQPAPKAAPLRSVLIVEDSITSRTLLRSILELAGYAVDVATDGAEGLRKLKGGSYDLVVSDIEMPELDGFGLTRAIRADPALADLPVILVTSLSSPADRERGAEAGANAYLVKSSFEQGNLLKAIEELV